MIKNNDDRGKLYNMCTSMSLYGTCANHVLFCCHLTVTAVIQSRLKFTFLHHLSQQYFINTVFIVALTESEGETLLYKGQCFHLLPIFNAQKPLREDNLSPNLLSQRCPVPNRSVYSISLTLWPGPHSS